MNHKTIVFAIYIALAAMLLGMSAHAQGVRQVDWMIGSWSYESELVIRGTLLNRKMGNATGTRHGRIIEIGLIQIANASISGLLQGFIRDDGTIAWNFNSPNKVNCNVGSMIASVTLDPAKKKMRIQIPNYSGASCEANYPWTATLYRN
jgi:hypothetical protein